MKAARATALGLGGMAIVAAVAANTDVTPFAANYEGHKTVALLPATARSRIEPQRSEPYLRYTMHMTVRWTVLERRFHDCSVMRIDAGRLWPLEYRHVDESDAEHDVHTRFRLAAGQGRDAARHSNNAAADGGHRLADLGCDVVPGGADGRSAAARCSERRGASRGRARQPQRLTIDGVTIERTGAAAGGAAPVAAQVPQGDARTTP